MLRHFASLARSINYVLHFALTILVLEERFSVVNNTFFSIPRPGPHFFPRLIPRLSGQDQGKTLQAKRKTKTLIQHTFLLLTVLNLPENVMFLCPNLRGTKYTWFTTCCNKARNGNTPAALHLHQRWITLWLSTVLWQACPAPFCQQWRQNCTKGSVVNKNFFLKTKTQDCFILISTAPIMTHEQQIESLTNFWCKRPVTSNNKQA